MLPTVNSINPPSVLQYQPDTEVVLQGSGFQAGDLVIINNGTVTPTTITPTSISFVLSTNDVESAGLMDISIGRGSETSNRVPLMVRPSPARREWFVGEAFRDPGTGAEAYLYVFNPTGRDASVMVEAVSTNGEVSQNFMVPTVALVRATLDTLVVGGNYSLRVSASQPVVIFAKSWVPSDDATSATSGAAQASLLHMFATGTVGNGVETWLEIGNLTNTAVQYTARAFPGGGNVTLTLAARSHLSLAVGNGTFWQRVTALGPLVVEQVVRGPGFRRAVTGQTQAFSRAYLAYGTASGPRTTQLHLVNPGEASSVTVSTTYHPVNGVDVFFEDTLGPGEQFTRSAAQDLGAGGPFWLEVEAPNGGEFVATATLMDPQGNLDGAGFNLQPAPAVDLMVSGGNSLTGWTTFLALTNPAAVPANAKVLVFFEGGGTASVDVPVPAGSVALVDQGDVGQQGFYAMQVMSDLPLLGHMVSGTGDMLSGVEVVTP